MLVAVGSGGGLKGVILWKLLESQVAHFKAGFSHQNQASLVITLFFLRFILEEAPDVGGVSVKDVGFLG